MPLALLLACLAAASPTPEATQHKVFVDPGHGAAGNPGNDSALCEAEQDVMLRVALHLERRLLETGRFEVKLSRRQGELVDYADRITASDAWGAELFLSLHSDARGLAAEPESEGCAGNEGQQGFSVLWSDEGSAPLPGERQSLAESLGAELVAAGFTAYRGEHYGETYLEGAPGIFVDRHAPSQRIRVLRRPAAPSALVETHQAWDREEAEAWNQARTLDRFSAAVIKALLAELEG